MKFYKTIIFLGLIEILVSCVGGYSFTGASIAPEVKTYQVEAFQNRASIVQATLASDLTNDLVNKINSSTSLEQVNANADVSFQGTITGYSITPTSIGANDRAAKNRLTITIRITFVNNKNPKENYQTQFSRFRDYDSNFSLSEVEESLINEISEELVEDIFNKSFVNW
jgi:outer membrane lipopolysaccharide assembly protein LptE/RlpB